MSLVRLFMAAGGATSTRSAASPCVAGIRNCTERKVNERRARAPLRIEKRIFQTQGRWAGQRWANRPAFGAGQPAAFARDLETKIPR